MVKADTINKEIPNDSLAKIELRVLTIHYHLYLNLMS